LIELLIIYL